MKKILFLLFFGILISSCSLNPFYDHEVIYKISGSASSVNITLSNAQGGTEQYSNVVLPFEVKYENFNHWFQYISAQNQGSSGSVTVEIFYRKKLVKKSTSSGSYVIATASYSTL